MVFTWWDGSQTRTFVTPLEIARVACWLLEDDCFHGCSFAVDDVAAP